jgi:hypothetical protein
MLGEHTKAKKLMERVQGLRQKIAGKSIPVEVRFLLMFRLGHLISASIL